MHCLGASYAYDEAGELRVDEHASNLVRLAQMLPGAEQGINPAELSGRVGFRATLDLQGSAPGTAWLGLVIHGRDGSVEAWPEQPVRIE